MKQAIQLLFDEHALIVQATEAAKGARALLDKDTATYEKVIREMIVFFRIYADRFHHHKEELILFPEMQKKNELLSGGILKEMLDNHVEFRQMVKDVENHLDEKKYIGAQTQLEAYCEMLLDHIAVENDEVFPIAESLFSEEELDKISGRFEDCDSEIGIQKKQELSEIIGEIEKTLAYGD